MKFLDFYGYCKYDNWKSVEKIFKKGVLFNNNIKNKEIILSTGINIAWDEKSINVLNIFKKYLTIEYLISNTPVSIFKKNDDSLFLNIIKNDKIDISNIKILHKLNILYYDKLFNKLNIILDNSINFNKLSINKNNEIFELTNYINIYLRKHKLKNLIYK